MLQRNELLEVKITDLETRLIQKKKEYDYQVACFGKNEGSPLNLRKSISNEKLQIEHDNLQKKHFDQTQEMKEVRVKLDQTKETLETEISLKKDLERIIE